MTWRLKRQAFIDNIPGTVMHTYCNSHIDAMIVAREACPRDYAGHIATAVQVQARSGSVVAPQPKKWLQQITVTSPAQPRSRWMLVGYFKVLSQPVEAVAASLYQQTGAWLYGRMLARLASAEDHLRRRQVKQGIQ